MRTFTCLAAGALTGVLVIAACSGCTHYLASKTFTAPNAGHSISALEQRDDGPAPVREPEQRFRVQVGPPEASLAVRVLEPAETPMLGLRFEPNGRGRHTIHLVYLPAEATPIAAETPGATPLDMDEAGQTDLNEPRHRRGAAMASEPDDQAQFEQAIAERAIALMEQESAEAEAEGEPAAGEDGLKGTILVLHGLTGDKERLAGLWGRMLTGQGYRAVLVDLRGHGESTGDWLTYGVQEARDLSQVIDAIEERGLLTGRLGVLGISYGGSTAIQFAARDPRVEAVAAIAPFADFEQAARDFPRGVLGPAGGLIPDAMIAAVLARSERMSGVPASQSNAEAAIAATETPMLLIHGTEDRHLPAEHSERLHAASAGPSHLVLMPGETHMSLAATPNPSLKQVRDEVAGWFDTWLSEPAEGD